MLSERQSSVPQGVAKSEIRIIGGRWRGRKLPVADVDGLRPTPDRVRETLFNWVAADCRGGRVLDCFAGSGALGFEAASRGARRVVLLERERRALDNLFVQAARLGDESIEIVAGDALEAVARIGGSFDVAFIDPPYDQGSLRASIFARLERAGLLADGARVYFEWPRGEAFELPSARLVWLKRKRAGQINYAIAEWRATG